MRNWLKLEAFVICVMAGLLLCADNQVQQGDLGNILYCGLLGTNDLVAAQRAKVESVDHEKYIQQLESADLSGYFGGLSKLGLLDIYPDNHGEDSVVYFVCLFANNKAFDPAQYHYEEYRVGPLGRLEHMYSGKVSLAQCLESLKLGVWK